MSGNHNSGRKPKWLTIKRFDEFVNNDIRHIKEDAWKTKLYARASFWVSVTVLAAIIVKFITG